MILFLPDFSFSMDVLPFSGLSDNFLVLWSFLQWFCGLSIWTDADSGLGRTSTCICYFWLWHASKNSWHNTSLRPDTELVMEMAFSIMSTCKQWPYHSLVIKWNYWQFRFMVWTLWCKSLSRDSYSLQSECLSHTGSLCWKFHLVCPSL